jgi:hypothetical protein
MDPVAKESAFVDQRYGCWGVKGMVPRIYVLALGELFTFKLKTHYYFGKTHLSNTWRKIHSGNKATLANEHFKGSYMALVLNWPQTPGIYQSATKEDPTTCTAFC